MQVGQIIGALGALAAAAAVSTAAWRFGALTGGGAVAATLVGGAVFGFGGLGPAVVLVLFFVSSSALSALPGGGSRARRGARQVIANGSVAALAASLHAAHDLMGLVFLGSVAAATADTWATEIGVRLGRQPRSILTLRPRPAGSSGAVSIPGTLGAAGGSLAVALAGTGLVAGPGAAGLVAVAAGGFIGSLVDSALGDALQAVYRCPACGARPEVARHEGCAVRAARVAGLPGLDNDVVNWLATTAGGAVTVIVLTLS